MSAVSFLPQTLRGWRKLPLDPEKGEFSRSTIWQHLESFFKEHGLLLWVPYDRFRLEPPNDNERCPDPFAYRIPLTDERNSRAEFDLIQNIFCPARTVDDRDVLIRLVAKAEDGINHLEALRRLASGNVGSRGDNHTVPVFRFLSLEDMTFAVFPLMDQGFDIPWFHRLDETIDIAIQLLEGLAFLHARFVAHQDIDSDNILINFFGGPRTRYYEGPFRSEFPIRYYFNDFEYAICFDENSSPLERLVSGIPTSRPIEEYGRIPAPEMLSGQPYCPFKCDVWQLGRLYYQTFNQITMLPSEIKDLYLEMAAEDPLNRPSANVALERLRAASHRIPFEVLQSTSLEKPPPFEGLPYRVASTDH